MIDWYHPRIYERLCCFGLTLFTLGVASHNEANPPVAIAAIIVATLLVVRLRIELGISRDEERASLERKLGRSAEIYLYKHIDTRRYLNLDAQGQCFRYTGNGYEPDERAKAIAYEFG
jgi:hypothetical protein